MTRLQEVNKKLKEGVIDVNKSMTVLQMLEMVINENDWFSKLYKCASEPDWFPAPLDIFLEFPHLYCAPERLYEIYSSKYEAYDYWLINNVKWIDFLMQNKPRKGFFGLCSVHKQFAKSSFYIGKEYYWPIGRIDAHHVSEQWWPINENGYNQRLNFLKYLLEIEKAKPLKEQLLSGCHNLVKKPA